MNEPFSPMSPIGEAITLSHPFFLPTHHETQPTTPTSPGGPKQPLAGAYALWLVPDHEVDVQCEGWTRFPAQHVALTPWMKVESAGGERDLMWKVDKILSEWNRTTHLHKLKLHLDITPPPIPAPLAPRTFVLPIKPHAALTALSLISRQYTIGTLNTHETQWSGLGIAYDEHGEGKNEVHVGADSGNLEVTGVEVWWTGLGEDGKTREWRKVGRAVFGEAGVGLS